MAADFDWVGAGVLLTGLILAVAAGLVQLRKKNSVDKAATAIVLAQEERELVLSHRDAVQRLGGTMDRLGDVVERLRQTVTAAIEALEQHDSPPRRRS